MQYVNHTKSDNEMLRIQKLMEEYANAPREEFGKRTPGETCAYERHTPVGEGLHGQIREKT